MSRFHRMDNLANIAGASRRAFAPAFSGRFGRGLRAVRLRDVRMALVAMICLPLLSACGSGGFKPLYGSLGANGGSVAERMAEVDVAPIPGRVGQRIRNELIFGVTGGDNALPPNFRLEVAIRETLTSTLVQRTGDSNSKVYNIDASFRLIDIAAKKVVLEGKSFGRAGFERFKSIFANVRARRDAEDRASRAVGTDLKSRLAAYFSSAS